MNKVTVLARRICFKNTVFACRYRAADNHVTGFLLCIVPNVQRAQRFEIPVNLVAGNIGYKILLT